MIWTERVKFLTASEFLRFYKLDKKNFPRVLAKLIPHMTKARPSNDAEPKVAHELEFACTLRWLAGGNYQDIHHHHGISESAFWRGVHACVYALLIEYGDSELGDAKFSDEERLEQIERTFGSRNAGLVRGCVGV
jgi:hypothetical protein